MNDYVHIAAMKRVEIGNNVLMASKIYISDCMHGDYSGVKDDSDPMTPPIEREDSTEPVRIEDNVWIGESVSILPGVVIGIGSIIGANSVVAKSIPPYVIAVGIPAKPIKKYNLTTKKWEKC
jgi:lipopolysaccharide O-acetyltransferase